MSYVILKPETIHINEFVDVTPSSNGPFYDKLTIKLAQRIKLIDCEVKLNHFFLYYSWFNISADLGNNFFQLIFDNQLAPLSGVDWQPWICDFTIPDGSWEFSTLRTWFRGEQIRRGMYFNIPDTATKENPDVNTYTQMTFADFEEDPNAYAFNLIVYPVCHPPIQGINYVGIRNVYPNTYSSPNAGLVVPTAGLSIFEGYPFDLCGSLLLEQSNASSFSDPALCMAAFEGCITTRTTPFGSFTINYSLYLQSFAHQPDVTGSGTGSAVNQVNFVDDQNFTKNSGNPYPSPTNENMYFYDSSKHFILFPSDIVSTPTNVNCLNYRTFVRNGGYRYPPSLGFDVPTSYPRFRIPAGIAKVFGFVPGDYPAAQTDFLYSKATQSPTGDYSLTFTNTTAPQITAYNSILVGCSLVNHVITQNYNDVIYAFAPDTASGSQISLENIENWVSCTDIETDTIQLRLYAEDNSPLQLRDPQRSASLTIRPRAPATLNLLNGQPNQNPPGYDNNSRPPDYTPDDVGGGKRRRWDENDIPVQYNPAMFGTPF